MWVAAVAEKLKAGLGWEAACTAGLEPGCAEQQVGNAALDAGLTLAPLMGSAGMRACAASSTSIT